MSADQDPSEFTRPFWEAVREGRLLVPECQSCGKRFFTPEPLCIHCGARGWIWAESPGVGSVYTLSVVHQAVDPDQSVPFALAAVDLDDGWSMLTHIVGVPTEEVHIGMRVHLAPTVVGDSTLPTFAPIGTSPETDDVVRDATGRS